MELDKVFVNHAIVNKSAKTYICANFSCREMNPTLPKIQQTVTCRQCGKKQYRGGNFMFLGTDAFTEEMEFQSMMEAFE